MAHAMSALTLMAAAGALAAADVPPPPSSLRGAANVSLATASGDALRAAQCSWDDGKNSDGVNLRKALWSQDPQACCDYCGQERFCKAWTFVKGNHECWLKSQVPSRDQWRRDDSVVSGTMGSPQKCSSEDGKNSDGDYLYKDKPPLKQDAQACCDHCSYSEDCVAWTWSKSTFECWLKSRVPSRVQWRSDSSLVSGTVVEERCTQLSGTYCSGHSFLCDCNYCDDFCEDTPCKRTCRVLNGYESNPRPPTSACGWSAAWVQNPSNDADGRSCSWMEGDGQGGKGDDCRKCDQNAIDCRRANPEGNCWAQ